MSGNFLLFWWNDCTAYIFNGFFYFKKKSELLSDVSNSHKLNVMADGSTVSFNLTRPRPITFLTRGDSFSLQH